MPVGFNSASANVTLGSATPPTMVGYPDVHKDAVTQDQEKDINSQMSKKKENTTAVDEELELKKELEPRSSVELGIHDFTPIYMQQRATGQSCQFEVQHAEKPFDRFDQVCLNTAQI